jgi:hypothetical protein
MQQNVYNSMRRKRTSVEDGPGLFTRLGCSWQSERRREEDEWNYTGREPRDRGWASQFRAVVRKGDLTETDPAYGEQAAYTLTRLTAVFLGRE